MVTGKFLGVRSVCRANCSGSSGRGGGGSKEGKGEEGRGGGEGRGNPEAGKTESKHIGVLLEPGEATFKLSAFCFTNATVSCNM